MKNINTPPLVSVILPTHNGNVDRINLAIQSILEQSHSDFECIVVDDSTDIEVTQEHRDILN